MLDRIKDLCKQSNISIAELERNLGFGNGSIRKWDTSSPSISNVLKVADYFDVTIQCIVDEKPLSKEAIELAAQFDLMSDKQQSLIKCYLSVI